MYNIGDLSLLNLVGTSAVTTTGDTTGVKMPVEGLGTGLLVLDVAAASAGTNPTYNAQLQSSPDNSTWTNVSGAASAQVTSSASQQRLQFDFKSLTGPYLRLAETIGGTSSPSFTRSANLIYRGQVFP